VQSWLRSALWLLIGAVLVSPPVSAEDAPGKPLVICAVPAAMPRTEKTPDGTPRGLDVAVAERLARVLGRAIEFHWCASAECSWHCLPEGRCDLVVGQPQDSGPPRAVAWSVPYAGAQFGLVIPREATDVRSLEDLRGKRVGIVTGTVAVAEKDHVVVRFPSREALLDGFTTAGLGAAFLDADFAAWYLQENPRLGRGLRLVSEYVPREHWNMAVAVRAGEGPLLVEINRALAQLAQSGELRKVYEGYGVPLRPPFTFNDGPRPRPQESPGTWRRIRERGELVVSMDPANLPYSGAREERPGFDVEVARALAQRLDVRLRIEWLDVAHETAVGQLVDHACDLVLGEAIDPSAMADDEPLAGKVVYSRPYCGTGYLLVRRKGGPPVASLAALRDRGGGRVGTEAGSIADYRLRQRGYLRRLYRNQLATLKALADGDIDAAYLWANVGWTLGVSPEWGAALEIVPGYVPEDHWNIAVALRPGDDELKRQVDAALEALIADGTVAGALARYHLPAFAPFSEADRAAPGSAATDSPIRHPVAERGREPQMQRVAGSRNPYSGLARVRSAGALVVGLDPNNLPFSTAHPGPAGLDYEIAGLLAAELGVALRVYWGISAHDSYPAHLTSKRRCDVVLGITPDDRFGQRVLYSRPYYIANYRRVVRAGAGPPRDGEPVAVEAGVALRALNGRPIERYPSTEAILDAVARGRVPAGYVIATRGSWLAHERWPGALEFLPPAHAGDTAAPVDGFPVCAAVRKTDGDLKGAIDRAWDVLRRSGRLGAVLARWHVLDDPTTVTAPSQESEPCGQSDAAPAPVAPAPAAPDQAALAEGQALFRGLCSGCHGGSGRGGKGPDLTDQRWIHGSGDPDIERVIRNGVQGTTMKKLGESLKDDQIRKVIAYIRSLARSPGESTWKPYMAGDSQAGRKLFFDVQGKAPCAKCHTVGGEGGRIGPALDRIASRRAPEFIMESIVLPSQDIAPEFEAVAVATQDGKVITGLRVNETNFNIQLREENGRFHSLLKRDLEEVKVLKKSLMPENLAEVLTVKELHDLFAYLMTLE
jgi:putative heme-binding domain-containing protein